jgi:hypothetical protein
VVLRRGIVHPRLEWENADAGERHRIALRAALLAFPGAWASHASAAHLHGLTDGLPGTRWHETVHISRTGTTHREPGLIVHGQQVPHGSVGMQLGLPSSSLPRACIEVAARRSLGDALGVMDQGMRSLVKASHPDVRAAALSPGLREVLRDLFDGCVAPYGRHRWVTTVRQAVRWADPAAESRLESLSRAAVLLAGLPAPRCGVPLLGDDGRTYWVDMWWEEQALIGEVDGAVKYVEPSALVAEKRRQEALTGLDRRLVRWGFPEVVPDPSLMLRRLQRHL